MFRFEVFVDDKKLAYVLWALSGHVASISPPQPVVNAAAKNGKIEARSGGRMIDLFAEHLKTVSGDLAAADIKTFCVENGLSSKSYSNVLNNAVEKKLLKRLKVAGKKKYVYRPIAKGGA